MKNLPPNNEVFFSLGGFFWVGKERGNNIAINYIGELSRKKVERPGMN